jgi:hypothetical protein
MNAMIRTAVACGLAACVIGAGAVQTPPAKALVGGTLIDGYGGRPLRSADSADAAE